MPIVKIKKNITNSLLIGKSSVAKQKRSFFLLL
jgi:hypothetical protein